MRPTQRVRAAVPARTVAYLALLSLLALGGCSLLVGNPVGDYVFPSDASADDADEHDGTEGSDGPFSDNGSSPEANAEATAPEESGGAEVGTSGGDAAAEVGTGGGDAAAEVGTVAGDAAAEVGTGGGDAASEVGTVAGDAAAEASGAETGPVEAGPPTYFCNGAVYALSTSVADGTYALKSYVGYYLDDLSAGGAGTGLDQWAYTGSNQQWTVTLVSGAQYKILAQNGLALTVGSGAGVQLTLQTYTGAATQLWGFTTIGSYYEIVNTGSCLAMDDKGGSGSLPIAVNASTFNSQTNVNQSWTLTPASSIIAPLANGTYQFLDAAGYSLDDESGGGAGAFVGQWIYATTNQQWTVTLVSGVQYKIIGDGGAALTATTGEGLLAAMTAYTGASNQLWVFVPNGSTYSLVNVGSYLALDDDFGGNGLRCNQWQWGTTANQQWFIGAPPMPCSAISVTTNTYSAGIGHITWKNTGTVAEINPQLIFYIPGGETLNTSTCAFSDQTAPGCSAVGCLQPGGATQIDYTFVGSLAAGSSITAEYSIEDASEAGAGAIASGIVVTANSCQ